MSLAQPLPLPSTADFPEFLEPVAVPYGFGREVTSVGIPIDQQRTQFVWLAGVNGGVDEVTVNGATRREFEALDVVLGGHQVTLVRFNESIADDVVIRGRGLLDPERGGLIENPGRVIAFIYQLVDRDPGALDLFTSEAARRSLTVRGVFKVSATARAQVSEILASCGAIWADSSPEFARFHPDDEIPAARVAIEPSSVTAQWRLADVYTQLRVLYAWDAARDAHQGSVLLRAPEAIEDYGVITAELDAGWLWTSAQAIDLGERMLGHHARPRWQIRGQAPGVIYPGDAVEVDAPTVAPRQGEFICTASLASMSADRSTVTLDAPVTVEARTEVIQIAEAFADYVAVPSFQQTAEGVEFVIRDEDGEVVTEARATLDGETQRYTDAEGRVVFPSHLVGPGAHTLVVEKGGQVLTFGFTA